MFQEKQLENLQRIQVQSKIKGPDKVLSDSWNKIPNFAQVVIV